MTPLDSAFLRLENRQAPLHIGSIGIFDGPSPAFSEIVALHESRIDSLPRYRQRVRDGAWRMTRPTWVDDENFRLLDHLRRLTLLPPAGPAELDDLMARVMSQPMDHARPLWECWVVEGLADGRWAMINKVHHCMVDGIAGTDLLGALLDHSAPPATDPVRMPTTSAQSSLTPSGLARRGRDAAWGLSRPARHPRETARAAINDLHGLIGFAELALPSWGTSVSGPIASPRCWVHGQIALSDIQIVRGAWKSTVNDVVLSAVTRGFRELIISRGEHPREHSIRTLVPVSARSASQRGQYDNRVTAMVADLPVAEAYPIERLRAVHREIERLKHSGEAEAGVLIEELAKWVPPMVLRAGLIGAFRAPQRSIATVTTNVPGPRTPLYAAGRQLRELYPYVPIADRARVGVAVLSYAGVLHLGVTSDRASTSDVGVLAAAIEQEVAELVKLARPQPLPRRTSTPS